MPNQTLLLKLKAHGMGDGVTNWIEKTCHDEISNGNILFLSGVQQRSILGLILFLIQVIWKMIYLAKY